jgi:hypothetical protein
MWCDDFDADLLKVVPGAAEALGEAAGVKLLTWCGHLTDGKINHPACWNGDTGFIALFWTDPACKPDPFYWTDAPAAECTFLEAVRDEWVHDAAIYVNGHGIWRPPVRLMEKLMYDLRGWTPLDDKERDSIRRNVRCSLAAAAERLTQVPGVPSLAAGVS